MKHPINEKLQREIRIMRLDEALEINLWASRYYGEYENGETNYRYLDTSQLVRRKDLILLNAEHPAKYIRQLEIVGDFYAVRKPSEDLLEVSKISCHNLGMFYEPLDILFNHKGFSLNWGKLYFALERRSQFHLTEPKSIRLLGRGHTISEEDASYFINEESREAYAENRGWNKKDKSLREIGVDLPISRDWTLGSFSLLPRNCYTAQISEARPEQQIVSEYSGENLEIALLRDYVGIVALGKGVLTMGKNNLPIYLRIRLGLGGTQ